MHQQDRLKRSVSVGGTKQTVYNHSVHYSDVVIKSWINSEACINLTFKTKVSASADIHIHVQDYIRIQHTQASEFKEPLWNLIPLCKKRHTLRRLCAVVLSLQCARLGPWRERSSLNSTIYSLYSAESCNHLHNSALYKLYLRLKQ